MKIQLKQIVDEGYIAPKWYGLAYRDYSHMQAVCYPIPLNVLVRVWKNICWKLTAGVVQSRREEELRAAKRAGYEDGYVRGYRKAKREWGYSGSSEEKK